MRLDDVRVEVGELLLMRVVGEGEGAGPVGGAAAGWVAGRVAVGPFFELLGEQCRTAVNPGGEAGQILGHVLASGGVHQGSSSWSSGSSGSWSWSPGRGGLFLVFPGWGSTASPSLRERGPGDAVD